MDMKDLSSSSEEDSLGSEEEDSNFSGGGGPPGNRLVESDSLLDSSDSDTDEDDEGLGGNAEEMEVDEDALTAELAVINNQLAENPYAYELYVEKIRILKKLGELDRLRETREKFSEMYPLSAQIWLEWIRDEIKLACTDEEKNAIVSLFERAVTDYLAIDVWLEYINFEIGRMGAEGGLERCRQVFERALGSCGIHVSMGSVIWDMYRDFEAALLGTTTSDDDMKAQENRYISLCRRQLSVPLLGMSNTYEDLKSKIEIDENTESLYKKALDRLRALETWEAKLVQSATDNKTSIYRGYIEDEKKVKSNPARIQCLFERAISENPLDPSIWLEYVEYLSKNLKIEAILLDVANRASRNCSWDPEIWLKYMNVVERFCEEGKAFETMKSVFEKAILYCGTGETAGTVWLKYLEFLRRKLDVSNPDKKQLEILRKTFAAAEQHLLQLLPEPNDYISEILLFRLRFEAQCSKSVNEEVTNIFKGLLSRGYGQFSKTWLQFIMQEITYGYDVKKIRSHYSKAISYVQDDIQVISNLWINFERDNGDLSSLQQCETKILSQVAKHAAAKSEQEENATVLSVPSTNDFSSKGKKRKMQESESTVSPKKGRTNEDTVDSDKSGSVFKVPAIPGGGAQKWANNNEVNNKPSATPAHGESVKHDPSKDNQTVFLSNLAFTTEENEIREFFADVGKVEEVRLAKDFKGRSKGFGYVCFSTTTEAKTALGKDRQPLGGRPAFVSKCDPDKSTRQKQFKYPTNLEKNKLFVKGLPLSLGADELRDLFKAHGDLKDCRLVTFRNGHSKGLAYVEFIDETCAKQAILKLDGTTVGDKQISVALSNPPARDPSKSRSQSASTFTKSDMQRRAPKAFVPRSLQLSSGKRQNDDSSSSGKAAAGAAPKSNQDFRNMFLK